MSLPSMLYGSGMGQYPQDAFGGYNHNLYARDGEIWDMTNMSSDYYPLLAPRKPRYLVETLTTPNGLYANDGLYWVDGTGFYAAGELKGTVTNSEKQFASLGAYIVILPDYACYNKLTGEFGSLNASWSGSATIQNGSYRRRGRGGQHHLRCRRGLGGQIQGGRRRGHLRGDGAPGEQSHHHHTRDRRRLPQILRKQLHHRRGRRQRERADHKPDGARDGFHLLERKPALGLQGRRDIREQARGSVQLECV